MKNLPNSIFTQKCGRCTYHDKMNCMVFSQNALNFLCFHSLGTNVNDET